MVVAGSRPGSRHTGSKESVTFARAYETKTEIRGERQRGAIVRKKKSPKNGYTCVFFVGKRYTSSTIRRYKHTAGSMTGKRVGQGVGD